jgi:REP element-mobilizing transposase RayT
MPLAGFDYAERADHYTGGPVCPPVRARNSMTQPAPNRHSMRLAGFDYAEHGAYFVTICTEKRVPLFGSLVNDSMEPNAVGSMIERWWAELPRKFPRVEIDAFVVMPNHVHGLLFINGADVVLNEAQVQHGEGGHTGPPLQVPKAPLPRVIQWFKTMSTNAYFAGVRDSGWTPVAGKVWQRGYYDHVVRRDEELNDIRQYIIDNPRRWSEDEHNPAVKR